MARQMVSIMLIVLAASFSTCFGQSGWRGYCASDQMTPCRVNGCVRVLVTNDGVNDCGDWGDELGSYYVGGDFHHCQSSWFSCFPEEKCVRKSQLCDGKSDCRNGRDELNCTKEAGHSSPFFCPNGIKCGFDCIRPYDVCDGHVHCSDGSDEKNCPDCSTAGCLYGCEMKWGKPVCACQQGFQKNYTKDGEESCVDINECSAHPAPCSQHCVNQEGSFQCKCSPGYKLVDNARCIAGDPDPIMYVTTESDISVHFLNSDLVTTIQPSVSKAISIAVDLKEQLLYWAKNGHEAGIFRSLMDGSKIKQIIPVNNLRVVEKIAIDWIGRRLYIADSGLKQIICCALDGSNCVAVVQGIRPCTLALHPAARLMFWTPCTEWNYGLQMIVSAGMDGSNVTVVQKFYKDRVTSLIVDDTVGKLYTLHPTHYAIRSVNFDGTNPRQVLETTEGSFAYDFDFFQDRLYFTSPDRKNVSSCNKHDCSDVVVEFDYQSVRAPPHQQRLYDSNQVPFRILIQHPAKQPAMANPCLNAPCSHACLLSPEDPSGFRCACPTAMSIAADNITCRHIDRRSSLVAMANYEAPGSFHLYKVTHQKVGYDSPSRLAGFRSKPRFDMAYDPANHSVVYNVERGMVSLSLETMESTILFPYNEVLVVAVDRFTGTLFWATERGLMVGSRSWAEPRDSATLIQRLRNPEMLVLAPELGLMFIVRRADELPMVEKWSMDGQNLGELLRGRIQSMAYYDGYVYFIESSKGTLERIRTDGTERTVMRAGLADALSISVNSKSVFWLTSGNVVNSMNRAGSPSLPVNMVLGKDVHLKKILAMDEPCDDDRNQCREMKCSFACVPTPAGQARCLCPDRYKLDTDGLSCMDRMGP